MSLLALALQIAATGALSEVMPEWVRVEMEPSEPLALAEETKGVLVAVFIGDELSRLSGMTQRNWLQRADTVELVIQVVVPAVVEARVGGTVTRLDTRRGGTQGVYAAVHRRVEAMFATPAAGSWGEVLQALVIGHPEAVHAMPGFAERQGHPPVPVLDYSIPCKMVMTPPLGEAPPYPWPDLVAKMRADPQFEDVATFVAALLDGEALPPWRVEQALGGLSRIEGDALGIGLVPPRTDTPPTQALVIEGPLGISTVSAAP